MTRRALPVAGTLLVAVLAGAAPTRAAYPRSGQLEIHFINVGHALSTLVIGPGPDGAVVLLDAGRSDLETYLENIGFVAPATAEPGEVPDFVDYTIASHLHSDHIRTFDEIFAAGYLDDPASDPGTTAACRNCYNGSDYNATGPLVVTYMTAAAATRAGGPHAIEVGRVIPLGDGASLTVVAVGGRVHGEPPPAEPPAKENDRSVAVLIEYGSFDFIWAGDLGGGTDSCCEHDDPAQLDLETGLALNITPGGVVPLLSSSGVDVLNVNHHGSETSTNHVWMNRLKPEVAVISVGRNATYKNPMTTVVDNVLLAESDQPGCITAPPALVLQTDESYLDEPDPGSASGFTVGDVLITSDGQTYSVLASGRSILSGGHERGVAGILGSTVATYLVDEMTPGCPMVERIELDPPGAVWSDQTHTARHSVTTLAPFEVTGGVVVTFKAGRIITLGDGFSVDTGGEFIAMIEPLTDCS